MYNVADILNYLWGPSLFGIPRIFIILGIGVAVVGLASGAAITAIDISESGEKENRG